MPGLAPANSNATLIMVCGAARSGTTMLDLMLGNSPDAFSTGEIYALFRPFRAHHFNPVCTCGDPDCAVWKELRQLPERELHLRISQQPGTRFVVDSSKDLRWVLNSNEWAAENGLPIRNVLIWKDPVDLAHSHWKRGRPIGYFRKQFIHYYQRFLDLHIPFVAVSYTRLVEDSATVLAELCAELGITYEPGREEFWAKQHHHFFGSAGTANQVGKGSSSVGLRRDFPAEFVAAYEQYKAELPADDQLLKLVAELESSEVGLTSASPAKPGAPGSVRPGWYYVHTLKAFFRRYFPERTPVVD